MAQAAAVALAVAVEPDLPHSLSWDRGGLLWQEEYREGPMVGGEWGRLQSVLSRKSVEERVCSGVSTGYREDYMVQGGLLGRPCSDKEAAMAPAEGSHLTQAQSWSHSWPQAGARAVTTGGAWPGQGEPLCALGPWPELEPEPLHRVSSGGGRVQVDGRGVGGTEDRQQGARYRGRKVTTGGDKRQGSA